MTRIELVPVWVPKPVSTGIEAIKFLALTGVWDPNPAAPSKSLYWSLPDSSLPTKKCMAFQYFERLLQNTVCITWHFAISGPFISLVSLGHVSTSPSSMLPVCVSLNVPQLRQGLQVQELRIDLAEGELGPTHPHSQWVPATFSKEWSSKDVKLINRLHPLQKLIICGAVPPLFLWFRGLALKFAIPLF